MSGPTQGWRAVEAAVADAPSDRCRRIAVAAAERALDAWPGHPPTLDASLAQALLGPVAEGLRAEVQGIAEELDARYLDLYDEEKPSGRTPGWETAFRRARAAAAVVSALDDDARLAASGALYEASYALDDDLIPLAGEVA